MNQIAIEGTIGVGKSSLIRKLSDRLSKTRKIYVIKELFAQQNLDKYKIDLEKFYSDMTQHALQWQLYVQFHFVSHLKPAKKFVNGKKNKIVFWDRFIEEEAVFRATLLQQGFLNDQEYEIVKLNTKGLSFKAYEPAIRIIRFPSELTGWERVQTRARKAEINDENGITTDYYGLLYGNYVKYLVWIYIHSKSDILILPENWDLEEEKDISGLLKVIIKRLDMKYTDKVQLNLAPIRKVMDNDSTYLKHIISKLLTTENKISPLCTKTQFIHQLFIQEIKHYNRTFVKFVSDLKLEEFLRLPPSIMKINKKNKKN